MDLATGINIKNSLAQLLIKYGTQLAQNNTEPNQVTQQKEIKIK